MSPYFQRVSRDDHQNARADEEADGDFLQRELASEITVYRGVWLLCEVHEV